MNCEPGAVSANLNRAEKFAADAAAQGAKLVLLPELMPSGYLTTEEIWNYAQTIDGPVVKWSQHTAARLGVYLGFSFLEVEQDDFYNAFVLIGPTGECLGRVRKNPPASIEAYFFRGGADRHVIETAIGRIGVGICYENLLYDHMCLLHSEKVDLVLSPAAAGRPKAILPGDVDRFERMLVRGRAVIAKTLAVPVVLANRAGPLETDLPGPLPYLKSSFPGLSSIVDFDGTVKACLRDEEGFIVADVTLNAGAHPMEKPEKYGRMWAIPVPWYAFLWPMTQRMGEKRYASNPRRRMQALSLYRDACEAKS